MKAQHSFTTAFLIALVVFGLGCGGTITTGTAKKLVNNKPAADGTCPSGQTLCGVGVFAICVDLQNAPNHCGTCDRACSPGIACQTGICQQAVCTGATIPFSGQPTTGTPTTGFMPYTPGYTPATQILADVNGDGRLDRIEWLAGPYACQDCSATLSEFRVSLGQPGGTFAPPDTYNASAAISKIFATDANGDGLADLYVLSSTNVDDQNARYHAELWLGQKDGHLRRSDAASNSANASDSYFSETAIGDLSGDGWPDLVLPAPFTDFDSPPKISVYLSDSTGALHLSQTFVAWSGSTFIGDWNGDGKPDLMLLSGSMELLYNRGDGTFEQPLDCGLSVGGGSMGEPDLVVEDFNRDGRMDIASEYMMSNSRVGVMLGLGGCGFAPISYYDVPGSSGGFLRAADMNGDGILDLVSVAPVSGPDPKDPTGPATVITDNLLSVLIGNPDGTFQLQGAPISLGPNWITNVTIGEVTGDQRPDILVSGADGQTGHTSTWENTCQ